MKKNKVQSASSRKNTANSATQATQTDLAQLRKQAEQIVKTRTENLIRLSRHDVEHLVQELSIHQIELEMQNVELRRTQMQLQDLTAKYMDLYDFVPVGYFTLDRNGIVLEANLTGCRLLGKDRHRIISQKISQFVLAQDMKTLSDHIDRVYETQVLQTCEVRLKRRGGSPFYAELKSLTVQDRQEPLLVNFVMAVTDITERKRAEEALRALNEQLEQRAAIRAAELVETNKELEAFTYSVSHDLRAPLRHMSGFIELLQKRMGGQLDQKSKSYMDIVAAASNKMGVLIDKLLDFARLGRLEMQVRKVSLDKLVKEAICEIMSGQRNRKIEWKISHLPDVYGDIILLRVALFNLISNAVKYTAKRDHAEISISCQDDDKQEFVCHVADNGVGFDMRYADRLFGVFQRLHTQDEFEGIGIGLANVKRIILRHGGRIWADSTLGQGAKFYFTLPKENS